MKKASRIELLVLLALLLLLAGVAWWLIASRPEAQTPIQTLLQNNPGSGRSPCSQCVNPNCASASCNMECEYGPDWCTTHVMGGGGGNFTQAMKQSDDYADFVNFRVIKNCKSMDKAGVPLGSTVTHVNGVYLDNLNDFAAAVLDLRGKKLRLIVQDGSAVEVTLK